MTYKHICFTYVFINILHLYTPHCIIGSLNYLLCLENLFSLSPLYMPLQPTAHGAEQSEHTELSDWIIGTP
jgi:hypothetical protein